MKPLFMVGKAIAQGARQAKQTPGYAPKATSAATPPKINEDAMIKHLRDLRLPAPGLA